MILAKVKGNVVSTHKHEHLNGHKLLLVREIDPNGNFANNKDMISVDLIDAGIGDTVLVVKEGKAVDAKYDLFPIPASDIGANPKLTQTSGY